MQAERRSSSLFSAPSLSAYAQSDHHQISNHHQQQQQQMREDFKVVENQKDRDGGGGEFDFSFSYCAEAVSSPIPADQIFHNGKIRPIYVNDQQQHQAPVKVKAQEAEEKEEETPKTRRKALQRLFTEDRQQQQQGSSNQELGIDDNDGSELGSVASESYCVWEPPKTTTSSQRNSSSVSKSWKWKDLLTRSRTVSDKNSRSGRRENNGNEEKAVAQPQLTRKMGMKEGGGSSGAGGGGRRSSYLPYRQELVGIFGSARKPIGT